MRRALLQPNSPGARACGVVLRLPNHAQDSTSARPPEVFCINGDRAFEFEHTSSRLMEMQSTDYLTEGHRAA